jgi:RNA polymerase sigma-70 factor (ECF subfamily)
MLGIAEGTSKSNLSRARLILKEKIESNQQKQSVELS